jgi:hypothetical protein
MKSLGSISIAAALVLAACGSGAATPSDGGPGDAELPPDGSNSNPYAACAELTSPEQTVRELPAHLIGDVTGGGADLTAPVKPHTCAVTNAPFGVQSAGDDDVIAVTGLTPGVDYVARMVSSADLSFYVITGCSSPAGPTSSECLLYEDATTSGAEVGHFVAPDGPTWLVVDYYATEPPADGTWSIDVYPSACTGDAQCGGTTPSCLDGRCVGCSTSFDCADPTKPVCNTSTHTCGPGTSSCTGDDGPPSEDRDDGPAGARVLVPNSAGQAGLSGHICNAPATERDYVSFTVTQPGDDWEIQLNWQAAVDLDLALYDAHGHPLGLSFYEHPEDVVLTYLPAGTYYAAVSLFGPSQSTSVPYQLQTLRVGDACQSTADCAAVFRNQLYRGNCSGGACHMIDGGGQVGPGGACDSVSDCAAGSSCASFFFTADADTHDVCGTYCADNADCAALGYDFVCASYSSLPQSFCVKGCTSDLQCPVSVNTVPSSPPWARLHCEKTTGLCK